MPSTVRKEHDALYDDPMPGRPLQDGEFYVTVNGIRHWCRIAGAGKGATPLVVIHGGPGGNVYNFERTIGPLLEAFATVVYYDQRGCGRSDPPASPADYSLPLLVSDLEGLRARLGLARFIPLGFSFGGELALEYALAHPGRVERLILQAPTLCDPVRLAWVQLYGFYHVATGELKDRIAQLLAGDEPAPARLEQAWNLVDTETLDRFLFFDPAAARLNRRLWEESGLVNTGDMQRALAAQPQPPSRMDALSRITVPALVMVGLHDRNVGVDVCRDISARLSRGRLVIFERSAHFPDIEEPERYAAEVRRFLGL